MNDSVNIESALRQLNVKGFRVGQRDAVERVLKGENTLVLMPTGAGKSLCYQLPAMLMEGTALVVSPLLALMREQVAVLRDKGVVAGRLDSSQSREEREEVMALLLGGKLKLLYVSPETLQSREGRELRRKVAWSCMVIDEAHCLSEWGQRFRPEYLSLPSVARELGCPVLALTATATRQVAEELCREFSIEAENVIRLSLRKENIVREIISVEQEKREEALVGYLSRPGHLPALVYVNRREDAENVASSLSRSGIPAKSYHAGMPTEVRAALHQAYLSDEIPVLVATTAFGMGVDKPNVRAVIHYHLLGGLESYLQESGRGGRDGEKAYSCILACPEDLLPLRNRIKAVMPSRTGLDSFLRWMLPRGGREERLFSVWDAGTTYDMDELVIKRLLAFLEGEGYFSWVGTGFKNWKVRPLLSPDKMYAGCNEEEKKWKAWLLEKKDFLLEDAVEFWDSDYASAQDRLEDLSLSGEWKVAASHHLRVYVQIREIESYGRMAGRLMELFQRRIEGDLQRLAEVWDFAGSPVCLNRMLEQYFGEEEQTP